MSRPSIAADTVTVVRGQPWTDAYGNTVIDWSAPVRTTYLGSVQPVATSEDVSNREGYVSSWVAYLWPPEADITERDRVEYGGVTFYVDGEPQTWTVAGKPSHVVVTLRTWKG